MDWTTLIGQRPPELAALRLMTVVHHLGQPVKSGDFCAAIAGESQLLCLTHLIVHPLDLAFLVLDQVALRPELRQVRELRGQVRRLLGQEGEPRRPGSGWAASRCDRLTPVRWERQDDVLAFLASRNLLQVVWGSQLAARTNVPRPEQELLYVLTETGAAVVAAQDKASGTSGLLALWRENCQLLRILLPDLSQQDLRALLLAVRERVDSFAHAAQLAAEDDLIRQLGVSVWGELP